MQLEVKMQEKRRNNVFKREQTTKKQPSGIFRGLELGTKVRLLF